MFTRLWSAFGAAVLWLALANSAVAQTSYSGTVPVSIPDDNCPANVASNFTVGTGTVSDVDIGIVIDHTYRGDLQLRLRAPDGTILLLANKVGGGLDDFNVMLNDETTQPTIDNHTANQDDSTATPWQRTFKPLAALSFFDGKSASGTWSLLACDDAGADTGSIVRADLIVTFAPANYADLSLTKTVSNATPASGAAISYTLSVTNAAGSPQTATSVTVQDTLPAGVTFVSATGFGSFDSGTGVWTVGSIPPGTTRTLTINVTVNASSEAVVTNSAEVSGSSIVDIDSSPGNGSTTEDDDAAIALTVSGARVAGTPPTLMCPAGSAILDWDGRTWTPGSLNNTYPLTGVGPINIAISSTTAFVSGSPALNANLTGGLSPTQNSLFLNMNNNAISDVSTTVISFAGAMPGLQFRLFDMDFNGSSFADKVTVTGSFNGSPVSPTMTNGVSNYVVGNVAIGDRSATDTTDVGNVVVTFTSPVDTLTLVYGNHTTAPANPGNQWMSIHDMTTCNPVVSFGMTKISAIFNDGVSPQFNIPGNDVTYTIALSNTASGSVTNDTVFMLDPLPANVTFFNGDADGAGPGTTPVLFANNGSGLTFNYATDVRYATTAPANFAACTYAPTAGYDANVRYICVNPKGRMTGKSGPTAPSFAVSFRARIN